MADTLEIFGVEYTNVAGIIAKDDNGVDQTYTKGGGHLTQDQDGFLVIPPDGSGGGGGSSDFSTATLTVTNGAIAATIPFIQTFGDLQYIQGVDNMFEIGTYDIVLYKNTAILRTEKNVTGNAELYDEEEGIWLVTGDISITAQ